MKFTCLSSPQQLLDLSCGTSASFTFELRFWCTLKGFDYQSKFFVCNSCRILHFKVFSRKFCFEQFCQLYFTVHLTRTAGSFQERNMDFDTSQNMMYFICNRHSLIIPRFISQFRAPTLEGYQDCISRLRFNFVIHRAIRILPFLHSFTKQSMDVIAIFPLEF